MILFLYTHSVNRARTSGMFYETLIPQADPNKVLIVDVSRNSMPAISNYIEKAEILVFDNSIILSMGKKAILERNFYVSQNRTKGFYQDVWNMIASSGKPIFLLHPSSDLHAVNFGLERDQYLSIIKSLTGIFWPYYICPLERGEEGNRYPFTSLERHKLSKADVIGIWDEIKALVPISIDFPHCLGESELLQKSRKKIWDAIVPGVSYETRKMAQKSVEETGLFLAPYLGFSRWLVMAPYLLYDKLMKKKHSTPAYQNKSYKLYQQMISMSRVSFTCGSELRFFVRKFIEVPAFRSAMIAYPSLNFREYGFEDGVHYLHSYPEEAGEKAQYLIKNPGVAEKLIQNAWELVRREHVAQARVNQTLNCLEYFRQGKLKSAGYFNGRFEMIG